MDQEQSQILTQIIEALAGTNLQGMKSKKFYFNFYLNNETKSTQIDMLDLSTRSYNSLKRAGYATVGELAEAIAGGTELRKIKNCGAKSCKEILEKLFLYQYSVLPRDKRKDYVKEIILLNSGKNT